MFIFCIFKTSKAIHYEVTTALSTSFILPLQFICPGNATIIVKAGNTIKESVPAIDLSEYPQYIKGTVFFKDGNSSGAAMNYNRFLDEMQFITAKGDTLTLIDEKDIRLINIAGDTFFYDQGYIKLINNTVNVKLGIKEMLRIIDKRKI